MDETDEIRTKLSLGVIVLECRHHSRKVGENDLHDVIRFLVLQPLRTRNGKDKAGIKVEEPSPSDLVFSVRDRLQHTGSRRLVIEMSVGHLRSFAFNSFSSAQRISSSSFFTFFSQTRISFSSPAARSFADLSRSFTDFRPYSMASLRLLSPSFSASLMRFSSDPI